MVEQKKKAASKPLTRRDVISRLSQTNDVLIDENKQFTMKLENVKQVLDLLAQDPDGEILQDNMDMDETVQSDEDDPEELECDGVTYKKGDLVNVMDSKKRKWTNTVCRLDKFCDKMANMTKVSGDKKVTRRKCGNFRHVEEDTEDAWAQFVGAGTVVV